jgi:hypothetical protein
VSEETFDEFLAEQGMLETCENLAIREIMATHPTDGKTSEVSPKARSQ